MSIAENKFYRHPSHQQSERVGVHHIPRQDFSSSLRQPFSARTSSMVMRFAIIS